MKKYIICFLLMQISFSQINPGEVIWEENFDNLDNWIIETGNGSWGWGNGELQYYKPENVEIVEVPEETGNNAVQITAKEESGADITDQWGNPLHYTSGRINTKSKVSVKYGVIETRVLIPDIDLGGWPAVWLLGLSNLTWPRNGEIDVMEMGQRQSFRDLHDEHNGGNGLNNSTVNQVVGANAIFYADEALVPDNPTGAASISWDPDDDYCRPYYNYDNLTDRFLKYRVYWNPDSILFSVIDNEIEHFLFTDVFNIDSVSDEFHSPFYFVSNLALGGNFTDAYSLGDPSSGSQISLPFPAKMLVDYIKVMKWGEYGEVNEGPPELQGGDFGLFTDLTPTDNSLTPGLDAEIYVWEGTLEEGDIQPYEGENGISWSTTGLGWFGAGIMSMQPINLFNFSEGHLNFSIKIPSNISFQIGIIDAWGNQSYVNFPSNQTMYELVRNGEWGHASIPVEDIRGEFIDLRMLSYEFVILEVNGASCEFGLDNIYWSGGSEILKVSNMNVPANNFTLKDNYPNPFNPITNISYDLLEESFVNITIYDMLGNVVNNLVNTNQSSGYKSVQWDATNNQGEPVSAGVYLYSIEAREFRQTKKMILLK
jgi:beta-glucanase (GH16 family)